MDNPIINAALFIAISIALAISLSFITRRKEKKRLGSDNPERYTKPIRTGEYKLSPVKYEGTAYYCLKTQWEKWRIDQGFNGERVVYWEWSTMSEIKDWHLSTNGGRR